MNTSEKVASTAFLLTAVLVAYRYRKRILEWFLAPPPDEYVPEDVNAAIYMADSEEYDYEWDLD